MHFGVLGKLCQSEDVFLSNAIRSTYQKWNNQEKQQLNTWFDHRACKHTGGWRKHSPETLLLFLLMLKIASRSYDDYGDVSFLNEFKQIMCFPVCNESGDHY